MRVQHALYGGYCLMWLSFEPGSFRQEVKLKWVNRKRRRDVAVTKTDAV